MWNLEYMKQISLPSDSHGKVCGYDLPGKPFLNFTSAPTIVSLVTYRLKEHVLSLALLQLEQHQL